MRRATKATEIAANAAQVSAIEAGRSVNATLQVLRAEQRAWLLLQLTLHIPDPGGKIEFDTREINTGKTPAVKINMRVCSKIAELKRITVLDYVNGINSREEVIFPNTPKDATFFVGDPASKAKPFLDDIVVSKELWNKLRAGKSVLITYGELRYQDVFGASHWMRVCVQTSGTRFSTIKACVKYNDIDHNQ